MEYFSANPIVNNSSTYKLMTAAVDGDNKNIYESHQVKQSIFKLDIHEPEIYFQTVLIYAVPIPTNSSETGIQLGNTMLNTSTYTFFHGVQEQTAHGFSVSGDNSTDLTTNGTNEETGQTTWTNDGQLNNSGCLPTNQIQEDSSQNVGPGNDQINTSVDSIAHEPLEAGRTQTTDDTQVQIWSNTGSHRSQDERDQTLADQLRLGTLRRFEMLYTYIFYIQTEAGLALCSTISTLIIFKLFFILKYSVYNSLIYPSPAKMV